MKTKTKNKVVKSAIQLPSGLWFTSKKEFAETLFTPLDGKTAYGYYTFHESRKHGTQSIRLRHANGEIFAAILSNGWNATARTVFEREGKLWNLFGLTEEGSRLIGTEKNDALVEIINKAAEIRLNS